MTVIHGQKQRQQTMESITTWHGMALFGWQPAILQQTWLEALMVLTGRIYLEVGLSQALWWDGMAICG